MLTCLLAPSVHEAFREFLSEVWVRGVCQSGRGGETARHHHWVGRSGGHIAPTDRWLDGALANHEEGFMSKSMSTKGSLLGLSSESSRLKELPSAERVT